MSSSPTAGHARYTDDEFAAIWEDSATVPEVAAATGYTPGYCRWRACILRNEGQRQ